MGSWMRYHCFIHTFFLSFRQQVHFEWWSREATGWLSRESIRLVGYSVVGFVDMQAYLVAFIVCLVVQNENEVALGMNRYELVGVGRSW